MTAQPDMGVPADGTPLAHIAEALARRDLSPGARAFVVDLRRKASRWPLTPKQAEAVRRIAEAPPRPDYAAINAAALARLPDVLARLLPGGVVRGKEWECADLRGGAGSSLRVRLTGDRAGCWCDFATGQKGGDPVSLAAAVTGLPPDEAARGLARMLGTEGSR
ncbi:hypothetical protein ACE7GA_21355 [Roseomonas sp. CCTCC AB2023176]|uniref:hypothetical protein n=1 Tax=Roseomonas sp. CCTCC AB2023176 TaxID=3342640 RepID=UPI0035DB5518